MDTKGKRQQWKSDRYERKCIAVKIGHDISTGRSPGQVPPEELGGMTNASICKNSYEQTPC